MFLTFCTNALSGLHKSKRGFKDKIFPKKQMVNLLK